MRSRRAGACSMVISRTPRLRCLVPLREQGNCRFESRLERVKVRTRDAEGSRMAIIDKCRDRQRGRLCVLVRCTLQAMATCLRKVRAHCVRP